MILTIDTDQCVIVYKLHTPRIITVDNRDGTNGLHNCW